MSKCVIVFIIAIAVQVINSKAQEGTTENPTIENKHESTIQSLSDNAQKYITLELSIIEEILDYSLQKLSASRSLATSFFLGIEIIEKIYKCATQTAGNNTQGYMSFYKELIKCATQELNAGFNSTQNTVGVCVIMENYKCAMQQPSDEAQKCKEELKEILKCANQKSSNGTGKCNVEIYTMQKTFECAAQKARKSSQRSSEKLPTIENMLDCAGEIPKENAQRSSEKLPTIENMLDCAGEIPKENAQECIIDRSTIKNILKCAAQRPHEKCEKSFRTHYYNKE